MSEISTDNIKLSNDWGVTFGDYVYNDKKFDFQDLTVAVSMMVGETPQNISSTEVKDWLEATSDLSDWVGGALPIAVTDLTEGVAETVRFRVTFTDGSPQRAFLRIRKP